MTIARVLVDRAMRTNDRLGNARQVLFVGYAVEEQGLKRMTIGIPCSLIAYVQPASPLRPRRGVVTEIMRRLHSEEVGTYLIALKSGLVEYVDV